MKPNEYFKDYPGKAKCYQTADGLIFHEKGDAQYHADGLKDKDVTTHKNKVEVAEAELTEEEKEALAAKATEAAAAKKAAAEEKAAKKAEAEATKKAEAEAKAAKAAKEAASK